MASPKTTLKQTKQSHEQAHSETTLLDLKTIDDFALEKLAYSLLDTTLQCPEMIVRDFSRRAQEYDKLVAKKRQIADQLDSANRLKALVEAMFAKPQLAMIRIEDHLAHWYTANKPLWFLVDDFKSIEAQKRATELHLMLEDVMRVRQLHESADHFSDMAERMRENIRTIKKRHVEFTVPEHQPAKVQKLRD